MGNIGFKSSLRWSPARLRNLLLRSVLAPLADWEPLEQPAEGYSLVVAAPVSLLPLLWANLRYVRRLDRVHLHQVHIVLDRPLSPELADFAADTQRRFSDLPLNFLHFNPMQASILHAIHWGWAFGWLSWCLGLAASHSRFTMIHDLDLLTLNPDFVEKRYRTMREKHLQYLGMEKFIWNGVEAEDNVMVSNQLMLETAFVRQNFRPIDLFSKITRHRDRWVHFDLTQFIQTQAGTSAVLPYQFMDMVHPAQMISQYTALQSRSKYQPPSRNTLLLLPYYFFLADDDKPMRDVQRALRQPTGKSIRFFDRDLDLSALTPAAVQVLAEMASQVERSSYGKVRHEVRSYFQDLESFANPDAAPQPIPLPTIKQAA